MNIVILVLIIIALVAVFSVQNAAPVTISFLLWRFDASLAILVFLSLIFGVIIGVLITSMLRIRSSPKNSGEVE